MTKIEKLNLFKKAQITDDITEQLLPGKSYSNHNSRKVSHDNEGSESDLSRNTSFQSSTSDD